VPVLLQIHRKASCTARAACKWFELRELDLCLQSKYFSPMQYQIVMVESEEGFAVSCPALPGCHSQGATHDEALANIREAIQLWLEVAEEDAQREAQAEGGRFIRELVTV
jgi:predicted RNase H-like HicB family nuclease